MKLTLTPDQAVLYCKIVLSEIALRPVLSECVVCDSYICLDLAGVSMPVVDVSPPLSEDQLGEIHQAIAENKASSMYRFARLLRHWRNRSSKVLSSRPLKIKDDAWGAYWHAQYVAHRNANPSSQVLLDDFSTEDSPWGVTNKRLRVWEKRAADKSQPGLVKAGHYAEYVKSVMQRIGGQNEMASAPEKE